MNIHSNDNSDQLDNLAYSQHVLKEKEKDYNENENRESNALFYSNMGLYDLIDGLKTTLYSIIKDIFENDVKGRSFFDIFWIEDRSFYIGLLLALSGILCMVIHFTPLYLKISMGNEKSTKT